MGQAPKERRRKRRHSPKQLSDRPLTIECSGPITISGEKRDGTMQVVLTFPDGAVVVQPPACHESSQGTGSREPN